MPPGEGIQRSDCCRAYCAFHGALLRVWHVDGLQTILAQDRATDASITLTGLYHEV